MRFLIVVFVVGFVGLAQAQERQRDNAGHGMVLENLSPGAFITQAQIDELKKLQVQTKYANSMIVQINNELARVRSLRLQLEAELKRLHAALGGITTMPAQGQAVDAVDAMLPPSE